MKPAIFLRIASILTLIHSILHTIGGVFGKPQPGVAAMVAETMRSNRFAFMGATRSYADFLLGMGLGVTILLTDGGPRLLASCLVGKIRCCSPAADSCRVPRRVPGVCGELLLLFFLRPRDHGASDRALYRNGDFHCEAHESGSRRRHDRSENGIGKSLPAQGRRRSLSRTCILAPRASLFCAAASFLAGGRRK